MNGEAANQIRALLDEIAWRWRRRERLSFVTRAAAGVALVWLTALLAWLATARESSSVQALLVGVAACASIACPVIAWWRRPGRPTRQQIARLVEDRVPGLDDRLVTASEVLAKEDGRPEPAEPRTSIAAMLLADTARRLSSDDADMVISSASLRGAALRCGLAVGLAVALLIAAREPVARTSRAALLWLSPDRLVLTVEPGDARVRPGEPFVVRARTSAASRGLVPELTVRMQDATRTTRMKPQGTEQYSFGFESVPRSFVYRVAVAGRASREFQVTLLEPPRIGRIDLAYAYPAFTKQPPRTEADGGDIYAPEGTAVTVRVTPRTTTAPVTQAALVMRDGREVLLHSSGDAFTGEIEVRTDTAYRVRLRDADGLENTDDPEYFVRRLDDRPPDVRILRPAGDKQVTPLEEVTIEARADDDHGVDRLELVVGVRGSSEKSVPLGDGGAQSVTGRHTVYMEDLDVKPGDFVSFYARARDVGRGKRPTEARSDIFFLEVTPFVDEFALAQSQAMAAAGGGNQDDLIRLQKDIISGTWKLQRRSAGAQGEPSAADSRTLGKGQAAVRRRTEQMARQMQGFSVGPRRRLGAVIGGNEGEPALASAARAMTRAEHALDKVKPGEALPAEMEALNHLLRAQAESQRKQIARQQAGAGSGGFNRAQQDLSTLFDRELQRQQQTNYETPQSAEERREDQRDDLLDRVRELARRQEALARQQEDLARDRDQMKAEEVRRRLERLTREQSELRREAEQLAQQMQQQGQQQGRQQNSQQGQSQSQGASQSGQGQSQGQQSGARALREASEDMRAAASELRREDAEAARQRSARALGRLQELARGMQEAGPDERRRAAGDVQLEARQLADRQRQVADDTARAGGSASEDERRRLAGEQQRLAERTDALADRVKRLADATGGDPGDRGRLADTARAMQGEKLGQQMRELADGVRKGDAAANRGERQRELARALDRLADRVGGQPAGNDREGRQLADDLARARELRERLGDLQQQIDEMSKQGNKPAERGQPSGQSADGNQAGQPTDSGQSRQRQLAELTRRYQEELRNAGQLGERLEQAAPGTGRAMSTPVGQQMVTSAPGTEAFKQDFSKWENLHKEIALGLEKFEAALSQRVVERAARERLRAGATDRVPDPYRSSVDRYYRALAQEPR